MFVGITQFLSPGSGMVLLGGSTGQALKQSALYGGNGPGT